jgi:hypothetical protein
MKQRGQAVFFAILALVVGIVAFIGIYGMNSRQNMELANSVAESIDVSSPEIEDIYMETIEHAVSRHGPIVYSVVKSCNSKSGNAQLHMRWDSPKGPRDAYVCQFPDDGMWWVVIEGEEINGDNIVTAFPRPVAKTIEDMIKYLKGAGYVQP